MFFVCALCNILMIKDVQSLSSFKKLSNFSKHIYTSDLSQEK